MPCLVGQKRGFSDLKGHDVRMPSRQFGVHARHRAEHDERLIDEMRGDVVKNALEALSRIGTAPRGLWHRSPAIEAGLESEDVAERAVTETLLEGEEVPVPPAILKGYGEFPTRAARERRSRACAEVPANGLSTTTCFPASSAARATG